MVGHTSPVEREHKQWRDHRVAVAVTKICLWLVGVGIHTPYMYNMCMHVDRVGRQCGDRFGPLGFRQSAAWRNDGGTPVEGSKPEFRTCSARRKERGKLPYLGLPGVHLPRMYMLLFVLECAWGPVVWMTGG